jgi:hypothetical protein
VPSWPSAVYGRPSSFVDGAERGVYIWFDGAEWQIRVYNPGPASVRFGATVISDGAMKVQSVGLEGGDKLSRRTQTFSFSGTSNYDVDGVSFSAPCAKKLTLKFTIDGKPVAAKRIRLGVSGSGDQPPTKTTSASVTISR